MDRLYIRVDEACSGAVQEALFDKGIRWRSGARSVKHRDEPVLLVINNGVPRLFKASNTPLEEQTLDLRGTRDE